MNTLKIITSVLLHPRKTNAMNVSVIKNFNEVVEHLPLPAILELIREGRYRAKVEALRKLIGIR